MASTKDATTLICTFSKLTNDSLQVIYVFYLSSFNPFNQPKLLFSFIHAGDF